MTDPLYPALAATLALAAITAGLTLTPAVSVVAPGGDKLHHLLAFAALALPMAWARPRWILPVGLALAAFGGMIEILQPYVGRGREQADWIADLFGIAFGSGLGLLLSGLSRRRSRLPD